ncbi:Glutathione-regulated potassium-efflux system protein KefC [Stieleria neptunia]|uniref:Glutathione-regulated potassium-efflux system protein KefC n=1 Tax=Stieleria neptunia TaxID=2527979 RepID=A0A518HLN4_9BACT|nr:cation:proton antiporter [Stieleria neptunia]QDV41764.1 Glutathione-regulated potassium-efflux system protein KefC [Stieleria neptunia]
MTQTLIHDLLFILAAGLLAGLICRWLQASVLIGYLVVGALLGQGVLGWVRDESHQLEHFTEAGVFLLLFSIGLEFSLDDLQRLGKKLFIGGATQMSLVALPVVGILVALGMRWQSAVLIASAVAFSSTVLVFKALTEWGQSQRPHGQSAIGILLFQDAALIPLLLLVPLLTGEGDAPSLGQYLALAAVSLLFVLAVIALRYFLSNWLIPLLAGYRSPELVILFTIVSLGGVTLAAHAVALPPAVGAFAAGLIFNGNRWTKQIDALVLPFRETFAAVFFVGLGLIFDPVLFWQEPLVMGTALVGVIVLKTLAGTLALQWTGMPLQRAFGMGIGLAHVGEFAFVLILLGVESGAIREIDYQRVVAIAVGSLILTPLLMKTGLRLVQDETIDVETPRKSDSAAATTRLATVIGAGPIGSRIASQLETTGQDVCLVDLSPVNLHPFSQLGFRTVAGDAGDSSILELAGVPHAGVVVVCVPDDQVALRVVRAIRKVNPDGKLLVRCRYQASAAKLRRVGADVVVTEETEASLALLRELNQMEQALSIQRP